MSRSDKFVVYPLYPDTPEIHEDLSTARFYAKKYAKKYQTPIVIRRKEWDHNLLRFVESFVYAIDEFGDETRDPWRKT